MLKSFLRNIYYLIFGKMLGHLTALEQEVHNQKELLNKIKQDEYDNFVNSIKFQLLYYYKDNSKSEKYKNTDKII